MGKLGAAVVLGRHSRERGRQNGCVGLCGVECVHVCTRLDPEKYSIANDTIVYFLNFDVWSVERHPQGSII